MNEKSMNVHQALCELKMLDKRIADSAALIAFVRALKRSVEKVDGISVSDYSRRIASDYQSINDLIAQRNAIKRAVVKSNAETIVKVCGTDMTVAEAIDFKNNCLDVKRTILQRMSMQFNQAQEQIRYNNEEKVLENAEVYVRNMIAAQPKDGSLKADSNTVKQMRDDYINANTVVLIDPINAHKEIERLRDEISSYEKDIDYALSTSNATTIITVSW